ncbi:unnamed protein product [Triticum turgidum subsp. durum]|uniref:DUF569 domain-containing protein n=1 Tax=Triticum turgidum subsp. durum TaxID=4567 RepID=A0A9R1AS90_TRITD|nr:unnamed protein product [Triticum turgidum subsp. durum]
MELFAHAKAVRLKSRHDKFLYADEDELHVTQDRNGSSPSARWTVEPVPHAPGAVRLRSRYGRYLAASTEPFLLGMTSVEWEPVRDGFQVRLKSRAGGVRGGGDKYLRANGGVPPWRNSVTHDVPHRTAPKLRPAPTPYEAHHRPTKSQTSPSPPPPDYAPPPPPKPKPEPRLSKLESSDSFSAPLHKVEGRAIHYHIADDKGDVDDDIERRSFTFNGSNLEELTQKLQEETGIDDLIVCTRSPISGKLTPLLLQLPPNNAAMHIVLVRESSKVAKTFPWPYGS